MARPPIRWLKARNLFLGEVAIRELAAEEHPRDRRDGERVEDPGLLVGSEIEVFLAEVQAQAAAATRRRSRTPGTSSRTAWCGSRIHRRCSRVEGIGESSRPRIAAGDAAERPSSDRLRNDFTARRRELPSVCAGGLSRTWSISAERRLDQAGIAIADPPVDQVEEPLADARGRNWRRRRRAGSPRGRRRSRWSRILADRGQELAGILGDMEPLGVQPALGDRRRDDRPARAHRVHDLRRAARPVERMVEPIGDQREVERLVVRGQGLLAPPADGVDVRASQEPRAGRPPGLGDRRARPGPARRSRPRGTRGRAGPSAPSRPGPPSSRCSRAGDEAGGRGRQARRRPDRGRRGQERRRGPVREMMDPRGRLRHRRRSSSARSRETQTVTSADRTIARSSTRTRPPAGASTKHNHRRCSRPTRPDGAGAEVQIVRVRHHQPAPPCRRPNPTMRGSTARSGASPAWGTVSSSPSAARTAAPTRRGPHRRIRQPRRPGISPRRQPLK